MESEKRAADPGVKAPITSSGPSNVEESENLLHQSLKEEILKVIAPYAKQKQPCPPFSAGEMIVFAVSCLSRTMTVFEKADVMGWICANFSYYKERAVRWFITDHYRDQALYERGELVDGFLEAFEEWDVPVSGGRRCIRFEDASSRRIFLRRWLEPTREGHFPFLDLPAELQNTIYELVFPYHEYGILVSFQRKKDERRRDLPATCILRAFAGPFKDIAKLPSVEKDWFTEHHPNGPRLSFRLPPARQMFAVLLANKQIYEEAMPIFYSMNRFCFLGVKNFQLWTFGLPSARRQHLTDVHINMTRERFDSQGPRLRRGVEYPPLKRLHIWGQNHGHSIPVSSFIPSETHVLTELAILANVSETLSFARDRRDVEAAVRSKMSSLELTKLYEKKRSRDEVDDDRENGSASYADEPPSKRTKIVRLSLGGEKAKAFLRSL